MDEVHPDKKKKVKVTNSITNMYLVCVLDVVGVNKILCQINIFKHEYVLFYYND